jgi:hypothetical protein
MKRSIVIVLNILCLSSRVAVAQKKDAIAVADSIQREATMLYRSEMASWYGTDIFLERFKSKQGLIGGYISYDTGKGVNNVFFGKGDDPAVLSTITFNYAFDVKDYALDTSTRKLTRDEKELYNMRMAAKELIRTDTLFKHYNNTDLNVIPTNYRNHKRVYVLTGPKANGLIILGNDYLIDFDKTGKITQRRKLHRNIILFETKVGDNQETGIHSHLPETGNFITATDVCTLMLYKHATGWKTHIVTSKNYVSIWDMKEGGLAILTLEAWRKISNSVTTRDTIKH